MGKREPLDCEIKKIRVTLSQSEFLDDIKQEQGLPGQAAAVRYCIQLARSLTKRRGNRRRVTDGHGGEEAG